MLVRATLDVVVYLIGNFMESVRMLKQIIVDGLLHCLTENFPFDKNLLFYNLLFAWQLCR